MWGLNSWPGDQESPALPTEPDRQSWKHVNYIQGVRLTDSVSFFFLACWPITATPFVTITWCGPSLPRNGGSALLHSPPRSTRGWAGGCLWGEVAVICSPAGGCPWEVCPVAALDCLQPVSLGPTPARPGCGDRARPLLCAHVHLKMGCCPQELGHLG